MIITISGLPGSGKTSVARLLAKKLGFTFYSMGDVVGEFALSKNLTLMQLNKLRNKDPSWDRMIDTYQRGIARKGKNLVIDGLVSFHIIPNSVKVFLEVKQEVGVRRIFKARRPDEPYKSFSEALKAVKKRVRDDKLRYKRIYGIDCYSPVNFDFVVDTSDLNAKGVVKAVLSFLDSNY